MMVMPRVIVLDEISPEGLNLLKSAGMEYEVRLKLAGAELKAALTQFDAAICRSGVKITGESLEGNKRLKCIARAGVGTDNIDANAAKRLGIIVMNSPTGNTHSTAEHAFTLMLALSRSVAPAFQSLKEGRWDRSKFMGTQVADKILGIVGLGRIGQEFAKRAQAFQMKVIGFDPFLTDDQALKLGIKRVKTVREMLPKIDYLTVHTPLTPETKDLIGMPELDIIKPGCRVINCARGGIYNEAALVEGLKSGRLGGVALDVYETEPCKDSPLFQMPNVLCTPHLGASTEEAQQMVALEAVELVVNFLTKGEIRHAVNMAPVDPKTLESLRGSLNMAYRLGLLLSQYHQGPVENCHIIFRGELLQKSSKLLTSAFCAGLLERSLDEAVNFVNAETLLVDRGVSITMESRSEVGVFSSSMQCIVSGGAIRTNASGTLFGHNMPRLIRLGDHRLEAYLDGTLLIFTHDDVPGIIGFVGTIFGEHKINIAQMAVGRTDLAGGAIGVLNLDGVPPQAALDAVAAHPHIQTLKVIELPGADDMPPWLS